MVARVLPTRIDRDSVSSQRVLLSRPRGAIGCPALEGSSVATLYQEPRRADLPIRSQIRALDTSPGSEAWIRGLDPRPRSEAYSALIFDKNSVLFFVLPSLSISNSIASTGERGLRTLRSTQILCKSSFGMSNSSFRVPER